MEVAFEVSPIEDGEIMNINKLNGMHLSDFKFEGLGRLLDEC